MPFAYFTLKSLSIPDTFMSVILKDFSIPRSLQRHNAMLYNGFLFLFCLHAVLFIFYGA